MFWGQIIQDLECQDEKFRFNIVDFRNPVTRQTLQQDDEMTKNGGIGNLELEGEPRGPKRGFRKLFSLNNGGPDQ